MSERAAEQSAAGDSISVDIVRGSATEEELAALVAVIDDAYMSEAAEAVAAEPSVSAWTRTQRNLRGPLRRDIPWGRFAR